jgi:hypothetical protein
MQTKIEERFEAMRREVLANDERWARARTEILALGDRVVVVPREALERIAAACAPPLERLGHPIIRV